MTEDSFENVPESIVKNKMVQQTINGISHFLILWIIMNNGPIHGYELMNILNELFAQLIGIGSIRKSSPSRVYPMLNKMEDTNLILGSWKVQDNKRVKFYEITKDGEMLLYYLRDNFLKIKETPQGKSFFIDFLNNE